MGEVERYLDHTHHRDQELVDLLAQLRALPVLAQRLTGAIQARLDYTYVAVVVLDHEGVLVGRWAGRPGVGEAFLEERGFDVAERSEIPFAFEYADPATFARVVASTGPAYECGDLRAGGHIPQLHGLAATPRS